MEPVSNLEASHKVRKHTKVAVIIPRINNPSLVKEISDKLRSTGGQIGLNRI